MEVSNFNLDWLSFTYKNDSCNDLIEDFFKSFPELAGFRSDLKVVGGRNFRHGMTFKGEFTIRYDDDSWDNSAKGVNVEVPSHGLQAFFSYFSVSSVRDMFILLNNRGCLPSRIDVCLDDYSKTYNPSYYYNKWCATYEPKYSNGKKIGMVTRMRQCSITHDVTNPEGQTFYLGSRRKKMLRIYDKNIESGGDINAIRYEVEMHSTSACSFFYHLIDSTDDDCVVFGDLLFDIMRICVKDDNYDKKDRWQIVSKWENFIKSTFSQRNITIPTYKPEKKVQSVERHFKHNKKTFLKICCLHGLEDTLNVIFADGLDPETYNFLQNVADSQGLPPDYYLDRYEKFKKRLKGV